MWYLFSCDSLGVMQYSSCLFIIQIQHAQKPHATSHELRCIHDAGKKQRAG